ncbi:HAD-IB family phosphatase [Tardisphaera miroshnichenkoae]
MKGVVIFDVDGTLDDEKSSWRLLYSARDQAALSDQRFAAFEAGDLDYERLVELTVDDLRRLKLNRKDIDRLKMRVRPRPEAEAVVKKLREMGWEVATVSAGVCNLIDELVCSMGIALRFCNSLEFDENGIVCCAKVAVNPTKKGIVIDEIRRRLSLPMEAVVTVGDHVMDFSMFKSSGHYLIFDGRQGPCEDGRGGHISSLREVPDWIERWEKQGENLVRD